MGRLLILALIVVLVVWVLRRAISGPRGRGGGEAGASRDAGEAAARGDLVSCAHCGVNLPRAEANAAGGRLYCSEEHGRLGPRDR